LRSFEVLAEIAFALAAIHAAGVVHRDLKPDNIILRSGRSPVLVDFGLALVQGRPDRSRGAGTSGYMAPEQLSLGASVDARADLYALGVIAHELLLSDLPARPPGGLFSRLRGRTSAIGSRLSAAGADEVAADTIVRMLSPRPHQRPPSAISVARIFSSAARRRTVSSRGCS
jgi:serine/threonine protein kinase